MSASGANKWNRVGFWDSTGAIVRQVGLHPELRSEGSFLIVSLVLPSHWFCLQLLHLYAIFVCVGCVQF